jgi:hypothetical protein
MTAENQKKCANCASAPTLSDWRALSKTIGAAIAFSSEVASGSREENASKIKQGLGSDPSKPRNH